MIAFLQPYGYMEGSRINDVNSLKQKIEIVIWPDSFFFFGQELSTVLPSNWFNQTMESGGFHHSLNMCQTTLLMQHSPSHKLNDNMLHLFQHIFVYLLFNSFSLFCRISVFHESKFELVTHLQLNYRKLSKAKIKFSQSPLLNVICNS